MFLRTDGNDLTVILVAFYPSDSNKPLDYLMIFSPLHNFNFSPRNEMVSCMMNKKHI